MALGGLDSALSGLRVAQQQLSVISNNVANVNTEGYTRKILPQATVAIEGTTVGVRSSPVVRRVDISLERDLWTQISTVESLNVQAQYLNNIQEFHGPPDLELSVAAALGELRDNFLALSNTPDDVFLIQSTVGQAQTVAQKINDFSDLLTRMRNDAQDDLSSTVTRVNDLLAQIADVNKAIKFNQISGKTTAALEDQRSQAVTELSQELEVSFFVRGDGVMVIQTNNGLQLADERAEELFFDPTPLGPGSVYFGPGDPNNTVAGLFVGGDPAENNTATDIAALEPNGRIGALLELRDNILPEHMAQLDEMAFRLAQRFDAQGIRLYTDGSGSVPFDSDAVVTGTADLNALTGAGPIAPTIAGPNDIFTITLDPDGPTPQSLNISLADVDAAFPAPPAANGAESLVNYINQQFNALPEPYNGASATLDANGQLVLTAQQDIRVEAGGAGQMTAADLNTIGLVTATTTADPTLSPLSPVPYIGFSAEIQVNDLILNNNELLRESTLTGVNVDEGSNEFLRLVTDFVFGDFERQVAWGTLTDDVTYPAGISVSTLATDLHTAFGFAPEARVVSAVDLVTLAGGGPLSTAPGNPFLPSGGPPLTDSFTITLDPGGAAAALNIDLSDAEANFPIPPSPGGAQSLVDEINAQIALLGAPLNASTAALNGLGQLVLEAPVDIEISAGGPGGMGETGLNYLGLQEGITVAEQPSFDIQIGQQDPVTITVEPGETEIDLLNKLNALSGVQASIGRGPNPPGLDNLYIQPGPGFGGELRLVAGTVENTGGENVLEALFGLGDPVVSIPHDEFRESGLGPGVDSETRVLGAPDLLSYTQKMISVQTERAVASDARIADEESFRNILQRQLLDESGVNLEEELSNLILVQTAFSAAARVVNAIDEQFQELLNAF